jgi:hypothetical protein
MSLPSLEISGESEFNVWRYSTFLKHKLPINLLNSDSTAVGFHSPLIEGANLHRIRGFAGYTPRR